MTAQESLQRSVISYLITLLLLTIPFWILGYVSDRLPGYILMNLPSSALSTFVPLIAALILIYRQDNGQGIKPFFRWMFEYRSLRKKLWLFPILLTMPFLLWLSYVAMRLIGMELPEPELPILFLPLYSIIFFLAAIGEEGGWMGYLAEPLLKKHSALLASLLLGLIWAAWHVIPFIQTGRSLVWVVEQSLFTTFVRVIMVWLYLNNGRSLVVPILFHMTINVSDSYFPNNGSHYHPGVTACLTIGYVFIVLTFWEGKTLTRYRFIFAKRPPQ